MTLLRRCGMCSLRIFAASVGFANPKITTFFFFNDTAPTEIYTLPLHDPLPILWSKPICLRITAPFFDSTRPLSLERRGRDLVCSISNRSEEHTSELQSLRH